MNTFLITSLVAVFGIAIITVWRRQIRLNREMSKYQEDLISVRAHVNASIREFQAGQAARMQNAEYTAREGDSFNLEMSIEDVIASHPKAQNVLADNHLGGCTSCSISGDHKLGDAIEEYGIDKNEILSGLNGLVGR